jgi:cysteine desulfurase / selenocysteine lyase
MNTAACWSESPKLVAFTHMSNVLGTINPAQEIIRLAHAGWGSDPGRWGAVGAALCGGRAGLDADFLAFSAHKMLGPTGIGVLYGRKEMLEAMPPFLGRRRYDQARASALLRGQRAALQVRSGHSGNCRGSGLWGCVEYLQQTGMQAIADHEHAIVAYAMDRLEERPECGFSARRLKNAAE